MQCNQFHSKFRSVSDLAILTGIFYEVSASPLLPRLTFKLRFFPLWETKELCIASPHCQNLPPPTPNTPKDEFYELLIFSPQRTIPKLERNFRGFHINFLISFFRKWNYSRFTRRAEFPPPPSISGPLIPPLVVFPDRKKNIHLDRFFCVNYSPKNDVLRHRVLRDCCGVFFTSHQNFLASIHSPSEHCRIFVVVLPTASLIQVELGSLAGYLVLVLWLWFFGPSSLDLFCGPRCKLVLYGECREEEFLISFKLNTISMCALM